MNARPFLLTRRQCLLAGAAVSLVGAGPALAASLPMPVSLPDALGAALKKGSPLVVMVSLVGCPFCTIARDHYLAPLQGQAGLTIVQIDMRNRDMVKDFSGASQSQDQLIRSWGSKWPPRSCFLVAAALKWQNAWWAATSRIFTAPTLMTACARPVPRWQAEGPQNDSHQNRLGLARHLGLSPLRYS